MQFHCFHNEDLGCYFIYAVGESSFDELRQGLLQLQKDPDWYKAKCFAADIRLMRYEPSEEGVQRLARLVPFTDMLRDRKTALIVNRGVQYGLLKMFLEFSEVSDRVQVFSDWPPAAQWLGLKLGH
jgi:hypothetical protein